MSRFEGNHATSLAQDERPRLSAAALTSPPRRVRDTPGVVVAREAARAASVSEEDSRGGIGVLLMNHGSHSPTWRRMLLDVHESVADDLLAMSGVTQVRTAFMEYTEPSIASQLRALDDAGVGTVVVVPLLLTISDHTFDDIPTICGLASDPECVAKLHKDQIEIHRAQADLRFAPLLDFSRLARTNLARRIRAILGRRADVSASPPCDGLVLVGYGSAEFADDWDRFFMELRSFAEVDLAMAATAHAWCGHLVRYRRDPTIEAIERVLDRAERALVLPMLVARDEMFQDRIIGGAVERCSSPDRVLYRPDAILPEPEVGRWIVESVRRMIALV